MPPPVVAPSAEPTLRSNPLRRLYHWVLSWAQTPYGTPALAVLSFAESSFFPIPPDVLQIALSMSRPRRSFYYALVSALASVVGGIVGWYIGFAFWAAAAGFFYSYVPGFTNSNYVYVCDLYQQNAFTAIAAAAFTPIPYKVFTIAAGACHVSLGTLVLASALGRSARFFLVAAAIYLFGARARQFLERYFEWITLLLCVLLVGGFAAIKLLVP